MSDEPYPPEWEAAFSEFAAPATDPDPRMRLRVWIDAQLVDEYWVDGSNPDADRQVEAAKARHDALVEAAVKAGRPWLIEIYDPAMPEAEAYYRFGNDEAGMVRPIPILEGHVPGCLGNHFGDCAVSGLFG